MGETLSQKEIDVLLQGAAAAAAPPPRHLHIAPYSFVRPPRVTKDRRATLEAIYGRFALALQALLMSRLRAQIDVQLSSVEQATFSEFILSLASPCAAFTFKLGDRLGGQGVMDLSTEFAFHLVDRLFGGPGEPLEIGRSLTSLEQTVVKGVAERMLALLRDAWQEHLPIAPELTGYESSPEMLKITGKDENVLVAGLEVRSGSFHGIVTVCLPMATYELFVQDRAEAGRVTGRALAEPGLHRADLESALQDAQLSVTARFPRFWLSARAVAGLREGQVVLSGRPADTPLELHVNGRLQFLGALGQLRGRLGLRILSSASAPATQRPARTWEGRVL